MVTIKDYPPKLDLEKILPETNLVKMNVLDLFYDFRNLALNRAPDTYVKLNLVSSTGQELAHSKTTVRRGQPNPLFKETFVFQVSIFKFSVYFYYIILFLGSFVPAG